MTVRTIDEIFRDFVTDGVPASGPFNPHKPDIRDTLKALTEGGDNFPDNRVIRLNNADEGTANNIVVTASVAIPAAAYQVLYILNVTQENTGPVTVSGAINRDLVTNINQPVPAGYLVPGMALLCIDTGTELRLLSYGDAEAIVDEAENVLNSLIERNVGAFASDNDAEEYLSERSLSKVVGSIYFNTFDNTWRYWDGVEWQAMPYATVIDGSVTSTKLAEGAVSLSKLDPSLKKRLSASGVLDVRDVYRVTDISVSRGTGTIQAGSNQLNFSGLDLKPNDHIWLSGAAGPQATYQVSYTITGSPLQNRILYLVADGFIFNSSDPSNGIPVLTTDTPTQIATKIRAGTWSGWTVTGSGATVIFTRNKAGATLGVHWSDVDFAVVPKNETLVTEGRGALQAKVNSVNGNVATLDTIAEIDVTGNICYHDAGRPVKLAMDADPSINEILIPQGDFFWSTGVRFGRNGARVTGAGLNRTNIYALPSPEPVFEFRNFVSGQALLGVNTDDFTLNLQNNRRHGIFKSRLWDGSGGRRVLINGVCPGYMGLRIGRDLTAPGPTNSTDQAVISQSVTYENFHISRTNPSQNDSTPVFYQEFVQEAVYNNVKALSGTDINGHGVTVAAQVEGCRGIKFIGSSFALANKGLKVTSTEGDCEGITLVTPTLETNDICLSVEGGGGVTEDVTVIAPRIIGMGNKFVINRCLRGHIESQDRYIELGGGSGVNLVTVITDMPSLVTDVDNKNAIIAAKRSDNGFSYARSAYGHRFDIQNQVAMLADLPPSTEGYGALAVLFQVSGVLSQRRLIVGPADSGGTGFRILRCVN